MWLCIDTTVGVTFDRQVGGWLVSYEADCCYLAMTDRKLTAGGIWQFCTGLLTVFLNNEVTILAGLLSYSLLKKSFGTEPG